MLVVEIYLMITSLIIGVLLSNTLIRVRNKYAKKDVKLKLNNVFILLIFELISILVTSILYSVCKSIKFPEEFTMLLIPLFTYTIVGITFSAYTDSKYAIISNTFTIPLMIFAIITNVLLLFTIYNGIARINLVFGAVITPIIIILALIFPESIGGGDVKLLIAVAFILHFTVYTWYVFISCIIGLSIAGIILLSSKSKTSETFSKIKVRFGISLSISMYLCLPYYIYCLNCIKK